LHRRDCVIKERDLRPNVNLRSGMINSNEQNNTDSTCLVKEILIKYSYSDRIQIDITIDRTLIDLVFQNGLQFS